MKLPHLPIYKAIYRGYNPIYNWFSGGLPCRNIIEFEYEHEVLAPPKRIMNLWNTGHSIFLQYMCMIVDTNSKGDSTGLLGY